MNTRFGQERMVAVLRHLLDTKVPSVVLPLGKTKLYQAVMTVLSKYGALEAESLQHIFNITTVCRLEILSYVGDVKERI